MIDLNIPTRISEHMTKQTNDMLQGGEGRVSKFFEAKFVICDDNCMASLKTHIYISRSVPLLNALESML